ncbi:MAG: PaaI family thioesterase [Anaerolineae bacterium]|nr:PaaI family thioesterase [Anaerolineae bacterium]
MNDVFDSLQALIGQPLADSPSPLGRWLGGVLRAAEPGSISMAYTVRAEMTNPAGVLHGGMIASMMDELIGMTVVATTGRYHASVNLAVDFLSSARVGDVVICTTRIVRQGRQIVHAEASLTTEGGKLIARATSNLLARDG